MTAGSAPDVRYQVFVSSTFLDLKEAREETIQAILELDGFPAGMELFPASNDEKWELIKDVIDDSDYYIVIVGGRYGSLDDEGVSYTEREYDYALATNTPVLGFIHSDPDGLPKRDTEADPQSAAKLEAFIEKVSASKTCRFWSTPTELGSAVSRSLIKTMKATPGKGWVRADLAMTPEQIAEVEMLRRQVLELSTAAASLDHPPEGIEAFAQGEDETAISYSFDAHWPNYVESSYDATFEPTWDQIFSVIGPAMFVEASEQMLSGLLNSLIEVRQYEQHVNDLTDDDGVPSLHRFRIVQDSFDKVKVQLVALGLIMKSGQRHGVNDKQTYWSLTPFGEQYVMRLKAERRPE